MAATATVVMIMIVVVVVVVVMVVVVIVVMIVVVVVAMTVVAAVVAAVAMIMAVVMAVVMVVTVVAIVAVVTVVVVAMVVFLITAIVAPMLMGVVLVVVAVVMTRRGGSEVVSESRHRQQMDGQYAAHYATHHSDIALDRRTVAHHSSVHVSFSAFDTVSTRDGFIDGGMLRRQLYTAAVERSRVNFPEYAGTSSRNDNSFLQHGNLDDECRFLTQEVCLPGNFRSK